MTVLCFELAAKFIYMKVLLTFDGSWFKYSLRHEISRLQVISNGFLKYGFNEKV